MRDHTKLSAFELADEVAVLTYRIYELFVRRFNIVRFLFGMRPRKKPSTTRNRGIEETAT